MNIKHFYATLVITSLLTGCVSIKNPSASKADKSTTNETPEEIAFNKGIQKIKHVVVVYMENHSFDNLYGQFPGANGISNAPKETIIQVDSTGQPYATLPAIPRNSSFPDNLPNNVFPIEQYVPADKATPDVTHRFYQNSLQINDGKMNKFVLYNYTKGLAMGYYDTKSLPLYKYATEYTLADNFFQSVFGGSFINHFYMISAAIPLWTNAPKSMYAKVDANGKMIKDGTLTSDGYAVNTIFPANGPVPHDANKSHLLPAQDMPTIGDRLSEKKISWAWYSQGWDKALAGEKTNYAYNHEPFVYFKKYGPDTKGRAEHLKDENDYLRAAKDGNLPAVSFVKPGAGFDEHPGGSAVYPSEQHAAELIDAALNGPEAKNTLIILTYDEFGGFWDHVNPPKIDRFGPGSRIPAIIIGPFAKKHFIDHTQYETVSITAFIEKRWGLKPLSSRDANANPLRGALQFTSEN